MLRRLLTRLIAIAPALIVILIYGEDKVDTLLVMSQVVLSLQLGFAIIPLIHFVSEKETMGKFVISPLTKVTAWAIALVLVFLNLKMLINEVEPIFAEDALFPKILISAAGLFFGYILLYISFFPLFRHRIKGKSIEMHKASELLPAFQIPVYHSIAVALDFSKDDHKILSYALGQGKEKADYILVHVVESASAKLHGSDSDDHETKKDREQLESYAKQLRDQGYNAVCEIGFKNRVKEIVRIAVERKADMLVMGAHGHTGVKDLLYGETVNAVRHELKIPVLVVTL